MLVVREPWLTKILSGSVEIVDTQPLTEQEFSEKGALHHWPADQPLPIQEDCWLDGVWCPDLGPLEDASSIEYERNMKGLPISY